MPTIRLTNSGNDWTGKTEIGRGRLTIGTTGVSGEVIPDGPGFGNVEMVGEAASESILNLNGNTETVNGLTVIGRRKPGRDHQSCGQHDRHATCRKQ